jgi:hypothetical protein
MNASFLSLFVFPRCRGLSWMLLSLLLITRSMVAGGIETRSKCQSCEPDHGPLWSSYQGWSPSEESWSSKVNVTMYEEGYQIWQSWDYNPRYWGGGVLMPALNTVIEVEVNPENEDEFRQLWQVDVYELPGYLYNADGNVVSEPEIFAYLAKAKCSLTDLARSAAADRFKAGSAQVTPPTMGGGGNGGCSSCGSASQNAAKFNVAISMGSGLGTVPELTGSPVAQIIFKGDLAQGDLLKLENFSAVGGTGLVDGSLASGTVTAREYDTNVATALSTFDSTTAGDGRLSEVEIVVTPAGGGTATTHLFERVTAAGGLEGVKYTRTEGTESESMTFFNTGTDAPWGTHVSGVFKMVNSDGSVDSWDAPPEIEPGSGATPTFVWTSAGSHVNGGYFVGELVELHEYQPADAGEAKVVTLRTYGKIGGQYYNERVLLKEEVSEVRGTTTLSTEVTRYGYDENPFRSISTADPYGTTNERFGKRLWTLSSDGAWSLELAQEIPTLVDYWVWNEALQDYDVVQEVEFVYGEVLEFTPWLNGPAATGDLSTHAGATAFFVGLMTEARANGFNIAGCRRSMTTPASSIPTYPAWKEQRTSAIGSVTQGVEYEYDSAYSWLKLGGSLGNFGLNRRQERWNAAESAVTWSASGSGNANVSVTLDQTGVARLSSTSTLAGGGTVNDSWQMVATADGGYGPYRELPSYTAGTDSPLWSTTTYDNQGRMVAETSKLRQGGTDHTIQTITTSYSGENGRTRSAGGVTLGLQAEDVIANGQRTSSRTDAQGITSVTVTDEATGELISETKQGVAASGSYPAQPNVTTSYAKTTNATTGEMTQTVTQSAGGTTRTVSVTVTDAQGRTKSVTDETGRVTS